MKKAILQLAISLSFLTSVSHAAIVTVTNVDDGVNYIGTPGTFYWAITNCNPGDTIAFNIPGTGPFYLQEPPKGFPLIYRAWKVTFARISSRSDLLSRYKHKRPDEDFSPAYCLFYRLCK